MYYPSRENKGADQLRGYREADQRLCFRICRLLVFPCGGSFTDKTRAINYKRINGSTLKAFLLLDHRICQLTIVVEISDEISTAQNVFGVKDLPELSYIHQNQRNVSFDLQQNDCFVKYYPLSSSCLCVYWFHNVARLVFHCSVYHCGRRVAFVKFAGVTHHDRIGKRGLKGDRSVVSAVILEPDGGISTVTVLVCLPTHQ